MSAIAVKRSVLVSEHVTALEANNEVLRQLRSEETALRNRIEAAQKERTELEKAFGTALGQLGRDLGIRIDVAQRGS